MSLRLAYSNLTAMRFLICFALTMPWMASVGSAELDRSALVRLVRQDCGSCHGMTLQGGLGTPLTREALADKPRESLTSTILYGRPGTAMPPWKSLLTEEQADWIASQLLSGFPEEKR